MYFTYVGDPQLSHQEPPHADAGLHQCINFLKRPVDSARLRLVAITREIFRCNLRRSTDVMLNLSAWKAAKPSDARPGSAPTGQTSGKTHAQL